MSGYDWHYIRLRFEAGETAYAISKRMGGKPTKQAIAARAKRERWGTDEATETVIPGANALPIVASALNINSRKLTDDVLRILFDRIGAGAPEYLACAAAGINPGTLIEWKAKAPELADAIQRARAGKLSEWVGRIDKASETDWKAAQVLLQSARETRQDFGKDTGGSKLEVVIHIDREQGVTIDGERV